MKKIFLFLVVVSLVVAAPLFATGKGETGPVKIGVFVPGVAAGSPLYEQLVSGAKKVAAENPNVTVKVVEAGFDQSKWTEQMTALAATGEYTWILTSNPSMPDVSKGVFTAFPKQKFIFMDAYLPGNPMAYSLMYNQVEQGYMAGYLAGLVTKSTMKGATPDLKVGAIVAQEYPALTKEMIPGYTQGFQAVDAKITLDYRVIGNWWDANKGADLANSMMDAGVDVILSIAGGAGQGIIKAAQARGRYVVYFDSNAYAIAPGTIVGCATLDQERAVYETVKKAVQGTLAFGKADVVDTKGGYVDFADKDPLYYKNVPTSVTAKMAEVMKKFRSGALTLPVPAM
jgi:basic membrane lipoprotein Med (substrate-binding protein (PBP1-ABC) superfamily)